MIRFQVGTGCPSRPIYFREGVLASNVIRGVTDGWDSRPYLILLP